MATHQRIKSAVTELVDDLLSDEQKVKCNTSEVKHDFECEVRGQRFDVEISIKVGTKKKH